MQCSECVFCYQDEEENWPSCHFDGWWEPPCETVEYEEEE